MDETKGTTAVVKAPGQSLVAHGTEWEAIQAQARMLLKSGFFPKAVNTAEKAIAIMLAGRELGLAPMQSIRVISIVDGKPTLGAEAMLALAYQRVPGLRVHVESTPTGATVTGSRPGGPEVKISFTKADAERARLLSKSNWQNYPEAMFRARAISAWCRVVTPDAILGCYTPEELEPGANAKVIDITSAQEVDPEVRSASTMERDAYPEPEPEPGSDDGPAPDAISDKQKARLWALTMARAGVIDADKKAAEKALRGVLARHGFEHSKDITRDKYEQICKEAQEWTL